MSKLRVLGFLLASFAMMATVFAGPVTANEQPTVDFAGKVTAISAQSISVETDDGIRTAAITEDTEIYWDEDASGAFGASVDDINVGMMVKVHAIETEGGLVATKIKVRGTEDDKLAFFGIVTAISETSITIENKDGHHTATITADTQVRWEDGDSDVAASEIEAGMLVGIFAHKDGESLVADKIVIVKKADESERIYFEGTITAKGEHSITVQSEDKVFEVVVNDETKIFHYGDGSDGVAAPQAPGTFDDLAVGQKVKVEAVKDGDTFVAKRIAILEHSDEEERIQVVGEITAIGDGTVTVQAKDKVFEFVVNDGTEIYVKGSDEGVDAAHTEEGSIEDLAVGMHVYVKAVKDGDTLVAKVIKELREDEAESIKVVGTIADIGEDSIVVDTGDELLTFIVNDDTEIDVHHGDKEGVKHSDDHEGTLDDLEVGMRVFVYAVKDGDSLIAKKIVAKSEDSFDEFVAKGVIKAVDGGVLVIRTREGDMEFELNSNTEVTHQNGDGATLADLKVGLLVAVGGQKNGEHEDAGATAGGSFVATRVVILDGVKKPERGDFELEGVVVSTNADDKSFELRQRRGAEVTIFTNDATTIVNADGSAATFENIAAGQFVAVEGKPMNDGLLASEIQLFNESHEAGVVGRIASAEGVTRFILAGPGGRKLVTADGSTAVSFQDGSAASLDDLKSGTPVLVEATGTGRELTATKLVILKNRGAILRVSGKVVKASAGALTVRVGGKVVALKVRPGTVVLLKSGKAIKLGSLQAGANVLAVGFRGDGSRVVTMVRVAR